MTDTTLPPNKDTEERCLCWCHEVGKFDSCDFCPCKSAPPSKQSEECKDCDHALSRHTGVAGVGHTACRECRCTYFAKVATINVDVGEDESTPPKAEGVSECCKEKIVPLFRGWSEIVDGMVCEKCGRDQSKPKAEGVGKWEKEIENLRPYPFRPCPECGGELKFGASDHRGMTYGCYSKQCPAVNENRYFHMSFSSESMAAAQVGSRIIDRIIPILTSAIRAAEERMEECLDRFERREWREGEPSGEYSAGVIDTIKEIRLHLFPPDKPTQPSETK